MDKQKGYNQMEAMLLKHSPENFWSAVDKTSAAILATEYYEYQFTL